MALLGNLGRNTGRTGLPFNAKQLYPNTTTFAQWTKSGQGKRTDNTDFIKLVQMECPAQSMICFGTGGIVNGVDDRGVLKIILKDSLGTILQGVLRLYVTNAAFLDKKVIFEDRTERLAENDIQKAFRLASTGVYAKEDSFLVMEFRADTNDLILDISGSESLIPITTLHL